MTALRISELCSLLFRMVPLIKTKTKPKLHKKKWVGEKCFFFCVSVVCDRTESFKTKPKKMRNDLPCM